MNELKFELKKVKTFQGMEGTGLNADLYINGVKCLFVIDEANGGEFNYHKNITNNVQTNNKIDNLINAMDKHIKTLPDIVTDLGNKKINLEMNRDLFIDNLLADIEKAKHEKKMQKLYETSIVFGLPNGNKIQYMNFKKPLSALPKLALQLQLDVIVKQHCKNGVVILNNNLKSLGLTY